MNLIEFAELGFIPDALIRVGIRRLLRRRIGELSRMTAQSQQAFVTMLRQSPLAVATDAANEQHYEVPAEFFQAVLGPRLKYSCCSFADDSKTLAAAEEAMLGQTCERAELQDGQQVLELGCGWGSLTLWMAEAYPNSHITAVSNSASQRAYIRDQASQRGLRNIEVITADMREFRCDRVFDRVVSVEMFEHMRNYELLLQRVSEWLTPDGKAFVHIFCHRDTPYLFETEGAANWMGRHFFTGGMMPSENLFREFPAQLCVEQQWRVNGLHYWRTSEAWLRNLDQNRFAIQTCFEKTLASDEARRMIQRWRIFFLACAELFRFANGTEWYVGHYRFEQAAARRGRRVEEKATIAAGV